MKNYKNILIILFLIPALISSQDDKEQLRKIYKTSLIMVIVMIGLIIYQMK